MEKNKRIYCCYHRKDQLNEYKKNEDLDWIYIGDNPMNKFLSEFIMFKYIYENDNTSDIIGCCHYRRQFDINKIDFDFIDDSHCIVMNRYYLGKETSHFSIKKWTSNTWFKCQFLFEIWLDYINSHNMKQYIEADKYSARNSLMYSRCCFIMTNNHFKRLLEYVNGVLESIDKKFELNNNPNKYMDFVNHWYTSIKPDTWIFIHNKPQYFRLLSYFGEWLVSNYITTNFRLENVKYFNNKI